LAGRIGSLRPGKQADLVVLRAAALGLAGRIGSPRPGKHADLVVLRAGDVNLAGAQDPIPAVVTAAHPGNVEAAIVAGRVVKRAGRPVHSGLPELTGTLRAAAARLAAP
uniref:amidohydrolase family protein n=1 Tax=Allorhizocola rhizosphaerae TaxID=1872709 RepID=UPI0013C2BA59